jgi:hypothetical protein
MPAVFTSSASSIAIGLGEAECYPHELLSIEFGVAEGATHY